MRHEGKTVSSPGILRPKTDQVLAVEELEHKPGTRGMALAAFSEDEGRAPP